jgi:hypothetical protein
MSMEWGLMWFDDTTGRSLEDKVSRAAAHYERKYGQTPTLCFVNPSAKNGTDQAAGIQIEALKAIGPHCLWIGVGEVSRPQRRNGKGRKS